MTEPLDMTLWNNIKKDIQNRFKKRWNAYYSGLLVQEYKRQGGKFRGPKPGDIDKKPLARWFKEEWQSIGGKYPTYRPTKRISRQTPKTEAELSPAVKAKQIKLKQRIKGKENLPKF